MELEIQKLFGCIYIQIKGVSSIIKAGSETGDILRFSKFWLN
jgi:hypothetical protein